jgi:glycerol-3-phosphate dehydrogenase
MMAHIIIIGGGGTAAALAHDLVLRGFKTSLFEKGELLSGTTGRHHGLLHSGARYAVHDQKAAVECIEENKILRRIAPQALEKNDGLFVAISEQDQEYGKSLLEACLSCGIPARKLTGSQTRTIEPALTPNIKLAIQVPDGTIDAWRLPLHFFATAKANGARIHTFSEVQDIHIHSGAVTGVDVFDRKAQKVHRIKGDLVVNAAGAWAGRVAALAGIEVPVQPGPGVMVAVERRMTHMVINRMHPAGEGDIIVPQRGLSVLGTSLWLADDPEKIDIPKAHIKRIMENGALMIPAIKDVPIRAAWSAARPLIQDNTAPNPQQISRTFECYDHRKTHGIEGLISLIGGKATTLRAMAEKAADLICEKMGYQIACRTRDTGLLPYRRFFH